MEVPCEYIFTGPGKLLERLEKCLDLAENPAVRKEPVRSKNNAEVNRGRKRKTKDETNKDHRHLTRKKKLNWPKPNWTEWTMEQCEYCTRGAGMAQWWEHSPPTNVARVRFPDPPSNVGRVCCFSSLHQEVFSGYSGFPSPQKPKFDLIVLIVNLTYSVPN